MKTLFIIIGGAILLGLMWFVHDMLSIAPQGAKAYSSYSFPGSKYYLENKIDSLVHNDANIFREEKGDNPTAEFYNTGRYFTINIDSVDFCFRYKGDSLDWANSQDSIKIFLTSINSFKERKLSREEKLDRVDELFIKKLRKNYPHSPELVPFK